MVMTNKRILIAGIGNIFLGDDAFGCEVVQRLLQRELPPEALVVDFGIRGFDLAYALLDDYELSILVDTTPRGGAPGTLYVIEIDAKRLVEIDANGPSLDAHAMDPMTVLALVKTIGGKPKRLLLIGCEPAPVAEQEDLGLSKPVAVMVDKAVELVESLVKATINEETQDTDRTVVRC